MYGKPSILALAGSLALAVAQPAGGSETEIDSALPFVRQAALQINVANEARLVVEADEHAGLLQIAALLVNSEFEEQWAFVPSVGLWIEVGREERVNEQDSEVMLDFDFLRSIVRIHDDVVLVHLHPASFFRTPERSDPLPVTQTLAGLNQGDLAKLALALPSADDVHSALQVSAEIWTASPQARIQHMVVSPYGLVTFGATDEALKQMLFEAGHPLLSLKRDLIQSYSLRRSASYVAWVANRPDVRTVGDLLAAICDQITGEDFRIEFRVLDGLVPSPVLSQAL